MPNENPYAAPKTDPQSQPPADLPQDSPGLWRQDDLLVMHRSARWPRRCVVTAGLATEVVNWRIGVYPSTTVNLSISSIYLARYYWSLVFCVGTFLLFMEESIRWKWFDNSPLADGVGPWFLACVGVLLPTAYYLAYLCPLVLHHSGETYVWLSGAHPDFLKNLPDWPYETK